MKVAVTIVAWNSMTYLPEALASIAAQTFRNLSVIIVDNASSDGVVDFVRERYPETTVIRNAKNLGFARGHNQAIAYAKAHFDRPGEELFVLVTNPDIIMDPDFVARMADAVERRPEVGSAGGKLLKVESRGEGVLREGIRTPVLDTAGIRLFRSRRAAERGAGETDGEGRYDRTEEVFGVSAALALYRMAALEDVAYRGEYFDDDFFAYKEDLDLAWRLRLRGWSSLYVPAARAYHYRTASSPERIGGLAALKGRLSRSKTVNYLSYRNHWLAMLKNEQFGNVVRDLPRIGWYELRKAGAVCLFEPSTLRAIPHIIKLLPRMLAKRKLNMRRARASAKDMRKWFA
jgi:GT2 family glycosyltransferase